MVLENVFGGLSIHVYDRKTHYSLLMLLGRYVIICQQDVNDFEMRFYYVRQIILERLNYEY